MSFIEVLIPVYCRRHLQISSPYIDFWIFIAVWLSMGLVGLSNIHKHFYHGRFWANYVASTFMTRYRFEAILGVMKGLVGQLNNILQHNLRKIYSPSIKGSIDETILDYTGKLPLKIYMKAKPHPNGVKLYTYVDENGVLLSFFVHKKGESQTIYQIFKRLLFHFKDRQLKIYADRWFGSKNAMEYCLKHRIKFVLAMQSGRGKKLWNNMLPHAMRDGYAIRWYDKGKNVRAISVKVINRNKIIVCNFIANHLDYTSISTFDGLESITEPDLKQQCESVVSDYNNNMNKVDQFNQTFYKHLPKIRQTNVDMGMRRSFLRFAVVNVYHLYKLYHKSKIRQDEFLEQLMYELLGFSESGWKDFAYHRLLPSKNPQQKCTVCTPREKASSCNYWCAGCGKHMCRHCYNIKHIK